MALHFCCPSDVHVAPLKEARAAIMELSLLSFRRCCCWCGLGRLLGSFRRVLFVRVCVCFWDEALKAVGCELTVAEHARLTGCFGWLV